MPFVHSFTLIPPERFDAVAWSEVKIEESPDNAVWTLIDTQALSPLDADPSDPATRDITTNDSTLAEGWFRVIWRDASANASAPSLSIFSPGIVDDGYPTAASLVAASSVDALTDLDDAVQEQLRLASVRAVEAFCHQSFGAVDGTRILNGNGGRRIALDRRLAVLDDLEITGSSIDTSDVGLTEDHDALYILPTSLGGGNWVERSIRDFEHLGLRFSAGYGTVAITGTWGWTDTEMPRTAESDIGIALRLDMEDQALVGEHGLAATVRAMSRVGIDRLSEGPLIASFKRPELPLSSEIQGMLRDYIWQPTGVTA